jgi:hypothetical protein
MLEIGGRGAVHYSHRARTLSQVLGKYPKAFVSEHHLVLRIDLAEHLVLILRIEMAVGGQGIVGAEENDFGEAHPQDDGNNQVQQDGGAPIERLEKIGLEATCGEKTRVFVKFQVYAVSFLPIGHVRGEKEPLHWQSLDILESGMRRSRQARRDDP